MAGRDTSAELTAAVSWWSAKRRDLAVLLAHDDSPALTAEFLKVHAVVTALQEAARPAGGGSPPSRRY